MQPLVECYVPAPPEAQNNEFHSLQLWHFKPTVADAVSKATKVLEGVEGPIIAVHLRGGDKRQENADLVRCWDGRLVETMDAIESVWML